MTNLVIGASNTAVISKGDDVIVLPGEMVPLNTGATMHVTKSLSECLAAIRLRFATHEQIATLGSTRLVENFLAWNHHLRDEWMPAIEHYLETIIDNLGNCAMDSWIGARNAIKQGEYLTSCPNTDSLHNALAGKPAICLGAGPSAASRLAHINPETHYVFCADAMLNGCGFVPHYVCSVERTPGTFELMEESAGNGARLIALPATDPRAAPAFNGKCLWWLGPDPLYKWLAPEHGTAYAGRSCGVLGIAAALLAGCNPIYLVGHDLAYDGTSSHCSAAHSSAPVDITQPNLSDAHPYHYRRFKVESNTGGRVESMGLWSIFRQDIEMLLAFYPDRTVINCGGLSRIKGAVMGELQSSPFAVHEPTYITKPIRNWLPEVPRIIANMHRIQARCGQVLVRLEMDADTAKIAEMMAVSTMVDADMALLFNDAFRALSNNLSLRLHYRATHGYDGDKEHRSVLRLLAHTMHVMCSAMEKDLQ